MGNSNSSSQHQRRRTNSHDGGGDSGTGGWTNSYPRDPSHRFALKVLPERIPGQRLRVTDNGAILQNGGTISGRRQTISLGESYRPSPRGNDLEQGPGGRVYRTRSSSANHQAQRSTSTTTGSSSPIGFSSKRFGSEPDLRHDSPAKQRISRSRKKYKAPAPPPESPLQPPADSSSPDSARWDTLDPPAARRARLFKTRAETKASRRQQAPAPSPPSLQRSLSSPEFQNVPEFNHINCKNCGRVLDKQFEAELLQAARRLRPTAPPGEVRGEGSGTESNSTPEPPPPAPQLPPRKKQPPPPEGRKAHWEIIPPERRGVPVKTFYFGMEQEEEDEREAVERFAASLQHVTTTAPAAGPAGGSLSSSRDYEEEEDEEEEEEEGGVALQLRPTLPKKQLEIPRFSPTAAWRLLCTLEQGTTLSSSPGTGSGLLAEDASSELLEERIQRLARPVAPPIPQVLQQQAPRSSHDKSGDSGISGDASPGGIHEDSSEAPAPVRLKAVVAWTPQQDLEEEEEEEDSSSDGGVAVAPVMQPKFSPRSHVFSLSLPRDDRLCLSLYNDNMDIVSPKIRDRLDLNPSFNSLKKLRHSVSGVLGAALGNRSAANGGPADNEEQLDENWMLSRSVPNSLHLEALQQQTMPKAAPPASFSYLASGGHVMYLPEYRSRLRPHATVPASGHLQTTSESIKRQNLCSTVPLSKSCDNVSEMRQIGRTPSPESPPSFHRNNHVTSSATQEKHEKRGKRFTFQSTVRQIERRRLAERLSREAELKEQQRLGELEAMRRVEEEFQKKRAREKANIRQQLRLFNLNNEPQFSSLPWDNSPRAEPDGAPSSTSSCAPVVPTRTATKVLSEFHQPTREYRDYRPSSRYVESGTDSVLMETKRTTVHHPQVVYDMPKNTQVYVTPHHHDPEHRSSASSDNYRREFAHGARPLGGCSVPSSDSELSQLSAHSGSRQKSHQQRHLHHSRSPSPASGGQGASSKNNSSIEGISGSSQNLQDKVLSSEEEVATKTTRNPQKTTRNLQVNCFSLTTVQPFMRNSKGYRPITFNPAAGTSHNVAQTVS